MPQFLNSNPVTDQMAANDARGLQQTQVANMLMDAADRRNQARGVDQAGRAIAQIYAEPPPPAPPGAAPVAGPNQQIQALMPQAPQMSTAPQAGALSQFTAQPEASRAPAVLPQASVPQAADPYADRTRRALQVAAGTPGGGALSMQLAGQMQKRQETGHLEALKALRTGDYQTAQVLNQQHGLGLDGVLASPQATQVATALARSIPAKLTGQEALAYQEAAAKAFQESFATNRDYKQALQAAGQAGATAARGIPQPVTRTVTDDEGNVYGISKDGQGRQITGVRGKTRRAGGGGSGGDASKGAKFDTDADGNRVILYRDGTMVYPKDAQGNQVKIRAGTNEDQKFLRKLVAQSERNQVMPAEDPVARARELARATGGAQSAGVLPPGIPHGAKQIGTSSGKPVYEAPDGKRFIVE